MSLSLKAVHYFGSPLACMLDFQIENIDGKCMCFVQIVSHELDLSRANKGEPPRLHVHIKRITTFQALQTLPGVDYTVFVFIHISFPLVAYLFFSIVLSHLCCSCIAWHS